MKGYLTYRYGIRTPIQCRGFQRFFCFIIFFFFLTMLAFLLPGQTTADAETGFAYAENPELLELLPF